MLQFLPKPNLLLALAFLLPFAVFASETNLSSDKPIEFDGISNTLVARQNATFVHKEMTLIADEIHYSKAKNEAVATGNVRMNYKGSRLVAQKATYNLTSRQFDAENFRMGFFPYMISGKRVSGTPDKFVVENATIHTSQTGSAEPNLYVSRMTLRPTDRQTRVNLQAALLKMGPAPLLPIPFAYTAIPHDESLDLRLEVGSGKTYGIFARTQTLYPLTDNLSAGANLDYYSKRGWLAGPRATFTTSTSTTTLNSGALADRGNRLSDSRGVAIGKDRGWLDAQHKQQLGNLELTGQVQYWSDSEVLRDFRPSLYRDEQAPESFTEAVLPLKDTYLSLFASYDVNNFEPVPQRFPMLRVDRLPTPIGTSGVYWSFYNSVAHIQQTPLDYNRYDGILTLNRPTAIKPWWQFDPIVANRYTYYDTTTSGSGSVGRDLGMFGFDSQWSWYKTYDVKSATWDIDGLKHVVQPTLQYRYMPNASSGASNIPAIETRVFDTNLRPTDFFYMANTDQLDSLNLARLGLKQSLQTRNTANASIPAGTATKFPSRELLTLEMYQDYNFTTPATTAAQHPHVDSFYVLSEASPCPWISFGTFLRLNWSEMTWQEHRLYTTLRDGDYRTLTFSTRYLQHDVNQYEVIFTQKLTDRLTLFADTAYDMELHNISNAFYGLEQRLKSGWQVQYGLERRTNDLRDSQTQLSFRLRWMNF